MLNRKLSGFTIVEVLIALSIGTLIIAIVFLAVPQAQRSSRDSARRALAQRLRGEIENYASNHEGQFPTNVDPNYSASTDCPAGDAPNQGDWSDFYKSNIQGKLNISDPTAAKPIVGCKPKNDYQTTTAYVKTFGTGNSLPSSGLVAKYNAAIIFGAVCSGQTVAAGPNSYNFAVIMGLESGQTYCTDNK